MAKQILRIIVVLSLCTSDASAQETDTGAPHNNGVIEEVVVTGVNQCGSWPIEHRDLINCRYAELKREDLQMMLSLRPKLFETCLNCQGNRCIGKVWRRDWKTEKLLCKRVFWTPTTVSRSKLYGGLVRPMKVSFTFKISTEGKVKDIELVSFEGDITEAKLLRLIKDGARKTRFEPLVIADMAYEIVGLRDEFASDDFLAHKSSEMWGSQILGERLFSNIHKDPLWLPFLESIGKSPEQLAVIEFGVTLHK